MSLDIAVVAVRPWNVRSFVDGEKVKILYAAFYQEMPDQDHIADLYTQLRVNEDIEGDFKLIICGPMTTQLIKEQAKNDNI